MPVAPPAGPVNTQITRDGFAAHIEPSVAVHPRDARRLLVACRVFQGGRIGIATYVSADGGQAWRANGLLPGLVPDYAGNAVVAFDATGRGFVGGIEATTRSPRRGDARIWRTDDGGSSFGPAVTAMAGHGGVADHPALAVDLWAADSPGRLYVAAALSGAAGTRLAFSRSEDGGRSFGQPRVIDPRAGMTAVAPVIAAGPGGMVCILYLAAANGARVLTALSSTDHGENFAAPVPLARVRRLAPGLGMVTMKSGPAIAADPDRGYLYAAVTSFSRATARSRILVAVSRDRGLSWSTPVPVAVSHREIYLQPQLAVDPAGRVGLSVCAFAARTRRIGILLYVSRPGRPRFAAPQVVTDQPFDPARAAGTGPTAWLGNYQGLAASQAAFHPVWTDTRTGQAQIYTSPIRR